MTAVLFASSHSMAASKDNERPDKEMLQMMDLLRDMEMIRRIDMMQDMADVESAGDQTKGTNTPKTTPKTKKEITK